MMRFRAPAFRWAPLIGLSVMLAGCGRFSDDGKTLDQAESALTRGNYNEAMILLHGVLENSPGNGRAQFLAARGAMMLGDFPAAEAALARAEQARVAEVPRLRAELLFRSGHSDQLLAWLDKQTLPPDARWAPLLRARALVGLRRCDEAIALARSLTGPQYETAARIAIAECYARSGDFTRAVRELRAATASSPDDAEAWFALGRVLKMTGDWKGAEQAWNEAAKQAPGKLAVPQQALLYSAMADMQSEQGDVTALRATHQRLVALVPGASVTELLDARIALIEDRAGDAVGTLRRLITKSTEIPAGHALLLNAYLVQGNFEQARRELAWLESKLEHPQAIGPLREQFDRFTKSAPGSPEYFLALADLQDRAGLPDLAGATLDRGLRQAHSAQPLLLARARLALRKRRADEALEYLKPLLESADARPAVLRIQAEAMAAAGRFAEADAVLASLANRAPDRGNILAWYAVRARGKLSAPYEPLEQWLAKNPRDSTVRAVYADSLREGGDNRRAIAQYELLIDQNPKVAALRNNLAWMYVLESDSRAVVMARSAIELAPKCSACADTYGWALVRAGSAKEAVSILETADREAGITRPVTRYHLAAAKAASGDKTGARALLEPLLTEAAEFSGREDAARLLAELRGQTQT